MRLPTSLALLISKKTTNLFQNVVRIVGSRGKLQQSRTASSSTIIPSDSTNKLNAFLRFTKNSSSFAICIPGGAKC